MSRSSGTGAVREGPAAPRRPLGPRRYSGGARFYDVLSGERPVYRAGRVTGVEQARLRAGARVLDVGCGTGLSFPLLRAAVGPRGRVVGVDGSAAMLAQARGRVDRCGWDNVACVLGDAADLSRVVGAASAGFDAVLFTYSLSVIRDWQGAFAQAMGLLAPGGRIVVVDMSLPVGAFRVLSPLVRLACFAGGADVHRAPWRLVETSTKDVTHRVLRGGHIHVVAGTRSSTLAPTTNGGTNGVG